jgi:hypothetical protein
LSLIASGEPGANSSLDREFAKACEMVLDSGQTTNMTLKTYRCIAVYIADGEQKTRASVSDVRVHRKASIGVSWDKIRVVYWSSLERR